MHIFPIFVSIIAFITFANAAGSCNQNQDSSGVCTCTDYCQCDADIHTSLQLKADCQQKAQLVDPAFVFNGDVTHATFGHHHHHEDEESNEGDGGDDHGHSHDRRRRSNGGEDHGHAHADHGHAHDGTEPDSHWDHGVDDSETVEETEEHDHDPAQVEKEKRFDTCLTFIFGLSPHPCNCHCSEDPMPAVSKRSKRLSMAEQTSGMRAFLKCYEEAFEGCNRHCSTSYQQAFESCKKVAAVE